MKCAKNEFTCDSGTCIMLIQRCDGVYDCADESDELDCHIVELNEERYQKQLPPEVSGSQVVVNVSIYVLNIEKIELPSTFHAKVEVTLSWKDYRLTYHDLHEDNIIDTETKQKLWIPPLLFSNSNENRKIRDDEKTTLSITKSANPQLVDLTKLHETYVYKGSENPLNYHREHFMIFNCPYNLLYYPFDNQVCTIDLKLSKFDKRYVKLVPSLTGNKGPKNLDQFVVTSVKLDANDNSSLIQCIIHMKRVSLYFIATTFMPTICIMFIALITLFIDQSHFEANIMVALTAMLVMYTLFQSIAVNLPTTAYLKLLDYWLIFGLIMPFFVFTAEVINQLVIERDSRSQVRNNRGMYDEEYCDTKFMMWARCILPLISIGYLLGYIILVFIVNFNII